MEYSNRYFDSKMGNGVEEEEPGMEQAKTRLNRNWRNLPQMGWQAGSQKQGISLENDTRKLGMRRK